ncbi:MAG: hypothetical protein ACI4MK_02340 [Aristaeellaceae bacterium]
MDIWQVDETLDFLTAHQVTQVYLSYSEVMPMEQYRVFVSALKHRGIGVAVIGAVAQWVTPGGQRGRDAFAAWLHAYLAGCSREDERFYGVHLDVEPHQLPEWQENEALVRQQYADFLVWAEAMCRREGLMLEADIPFWFDSLDAELEGQRMSLGEIALRLCDTTLLMSYRDNAPAVLACGDKLIPLARALGKKLILAVETGKIYESINITFHHLGTLRMYRELKHLHELVQADDDAGEIGYAIHYYDSWRHLPEHGHPRLEDYPYDNPNYAWTEEDA